MDSSIKVKRITDIESRKRGNECEKNVKAFLEKNDIPYWMNVLVRGELRDITEFDFIIPGATIECKYNFNFGRNDNLIKQISIQLGLTGDLLLYIYFLNITSEQIDKLNARFVTDHIDYKRVRIITDLNDLLIHKKKLTYVILENNTLYPFVNSAENKDNVCYVEKMNYYKLKLILDDDSKIFDDYKIILFDGEKIRPCRTTIQQFDGYNDISLMTNDTTVILRSKPANTKVFVYDLTKLRYLFNVFHKISPVDPTFANDKYPTKFVENITTLCVCGTHYIFCNSKRTDKCSKIPKEDKEVEIKERNYKRAKITYTNE